MYDVNTLRRRWAELRQEVSVSRGSDFCHIAMWCVLCA